MTAPGDAPALPPDPAALLRDRSYVVLLVFAAIIGAPIAFLAYFFLKIVAVGQEWFFVTLPKDLGFDSAPAWWPLVPLALGGLLVSLSIRYLPGTGGHEPADGFNASTPSKGSELPGVLAAALGSLCLGAVVGPEAPLIALGGGLAALAMRLVKRDAPAMALAVIAGAGSFAAVSTLLGSPIAGAFLLMEAAGLGGGLLSIVLLPGFLAAGIGTLIFVGLDRWTGFGTLSLAVPDIPPAGTPTGAEFLWALVIGVLAAVVATGIRRLALLVRPVVARRRIALTVVAGLAIAGLAIVFAQWTDKSASNVLFSGESALPQLIEQASTWTVGALVLLIVCKGLAYSLSLSSFRGGPTFPGMFIGAAGGIALSHLAGLPMIDGAAMGIGAMTAAMLGLPLTAVLLTSVFLPTDSIQLMPLVIVAVVVSYVVTARLAPRKPPGVAEDQPAPTPTPTPTPAS